MSSALFSSFDHKNDSDSKFLKDRVVCHFSITLI